MSDDNEILLCMGGISMAVSVGIFCTDYKKMRIKVRNHYVNLSMQIKY